MSLNKKSNAAVSPEFYFLAERKLAGSITYEEHARFEKHLMQNRASAEYYVSLCAVEAAAPEALRIQRENAEKNKRGAKIISFRRSTLALVASLFVFAGTGAFLFSKQIFDAGAPAAALDEATGPVCRISLVLGASHNGKRLEPNSDLSEGALTIDTGAVELVFRKGAHVLLEAPASLAITGPNACRLTYGKAVATVPDSAKGFLIETPKDRVIDYGTRFALDVSPCGGRTMLGVLSGIVDLEHNGETTRLFTDYAVESTDDGVVSVPFRRNDFLTEMPSQEYAWNLDGLALDKPHTLRFDVSRIIKTPGEIQVIFKHLRGENGLDVKKISLERDGIPVIVSNIQRRAGSQIRYTHNNFFPLELPKDIPLTGKWELVAETVCKRHYGIQPAGSTISSQGIFIFEKGAPRQAEAQDFIGRWQFSHNERTYVNEFRQDGTVLMSINGIPRDFKNKLPVWTFENGIATIDFRRKGWIPLKVILRNKDTMIFLNQSYRNAQRVK